MPPWDFWQELGQDVWPLRPSPPPGAQEREWEDERHYYWQDEWGVVRARSKPEGYYYHVVSHPLAAGMEAGRDYPWPEGGDPARVAGMPAQVRAIREKAGAVAIAGWSLCAGIYEMAQRLRGVANIYMDLAADPEAVAALFDRVLEIKKSYWTNVIRTVGDEVSVFMEADDFAGQEGNLVSPRLYVTLLQPRHAALTAHIKGLKPGAFVFLHSCGSIVDLLPHFIEAGFDAINPVQVSARGMDPARLKKDYGERICFWGGGVDTQRVLPRGTPAEVRAEVFRRMEVLAPGGGFVFTPVHNVQPDVPPQNLEAMWRAYQDFIAGEKS
jgi:uroporphyrinogen decarboxylase